jgi:hypothetical protein
MISLFWANATSQSRSSNTCRNAIQSLVPGRNREETQSPEFTPTENEETLAEKRKPRQKPASLSEPLFGWDGDVETPAKVTESFLFEY